VRFAEELKGEKEKATVAKIDLEANDAYESEI
jgi:hypothetical protein